MKIIAALIFFSFIISCENNYKSNHIEKLVKQYLKDSLAPQFNDPNFEYVSTQIDTIHHVNFNDWLQFDTDRYNQHMKDYGTNEWNIAKAKIAGIYLQSKLIDKYLISNFSKDSICIRVHSTIRIKNSHNGLEIHKAGFMYDRKTDKLLFCGSEDAIAL